MRTPADALRRPAPMMAAPFILLLIAAAGLSPRGSLEAAAGGADENGAAPVPVRWRIEEGLEQRFRIEYENSQRLEALDDRGRPLGPGPVADQPRRIAADVLWSWTRLGRDEAAARVTIERLRAVGLPGWRGEGDPPAGLELEARVALKPGAEQRIRLSWKRQRDGTQLLRFAGTPRAPRDLQELLGEAIEELWRHMPPPEMPAAKIGDRWGAAREFPLQGERKLRAAAEIEIVDLLELEGGSAAGGDGRKPIRAARIEGAIRQRVPGLPPEIQHGAGLFPGSIRWLHDLDAGFPRLIEVEKIARIPIPDEKLPTLLTLTHAYRLRAGAPESFESAVPAAE